METRRRYRAPAEDAFATLIQMRALGGFLVEPMPPLEVRDRYLDAAGQPLLRAGHLLRLRSHGGMITASLRAVEAEAGEEVAHARFPEEDLQEGVFELPEGSLRTAVDDVIQGRPLMPLLQFRQYRTPRALYDGDRLAGVLSLDVLADQTDADKSVVTSEVEVEVVRGGSVQDLDRIDSELQQLGFEPDPFSKFERGLVRRSIGDDAPLMLLPRERAALETLRSSESAVERRRAEAILLAGEGVGTREISRQIGLAPSRVRHWQDAFRFERMRVFDNAAPEIALTEAPESESEPTFHVTELVGDAAGYRIEPAKPSPTGHVETVEQALSRVLAAVRAQQASAEPEREADLLAMPDEPPVLAQPQSEEDFLSDAWLSLDGVALELPQSPDGDHDVDPDSETPESPAGETPAEDHPAGADATWDGEEASPEPSPAGETPAEDDPAGADAAWDGEEASPEPSPAGETPAEDDPAGAEATVRSEEPVLYGMGPGALAPPAIDALPLDSEASQREAVASRLDHAAETLAEVFDSEPDAHAVGRARLAMASVGAALHVFGDVVEERDSRRLAHDARDLATSLDDLGALDEALRATAQGSFAAQGFGDASRVARAFAWTVWRVERRRLLEDGVTDRAARLATRLTEVASDVRQGDEPAPPVKAVLGSRVWAAYESLRARQEDRPPELRSTHARLLSLEALLAMLPAEAAASASGEVFQARLATGAVLVTDAVSERIDAFIDQWVLDGGAAGREPLDQLREHWVTNRTSLAAAVEDRLASLESIAFRRALADAIAAV